MADGDKEFTFVYSFRYPLIKLPISTVYKEGGGGKLVPLVVRNKYQRTGG